MFLEIMVLHGTSSCTLAIVIASAVVALSGLKKVGQLVKRGLS